MIPGTPTRVGLPEASGYASGLYAASLATFGSPRELERSGGWILARVIPGTDARDAMHPYPLLVVRDWSKLPEDLAEFSEELVSLIAVTDPFGQYDEQLLRACFPDLVLAFKQHYVARMDRHGARWISRHHLRNVRKARSRVRVDVCADPETALDDWVRLYGVLVDRHAIRGVAAFSRGAFALQLRTPGAVVMRATSGGETVGMLLWYVVSGIGYYHLGAYTASGYGLGASFALFDAALEYFVARGIEWLDLGGAAGASVADGDGLARFKRGWANAVRTAYLCGRVFDRRRYEHLIEATGTRAFVGRYFPAYRAGESLGALAGATASSSATK